ncbi:hypothetical protein O7626_03040 [Micromonospora sp. WMMD1102]|uniref:hypothetical protein n=1 Tax=Micromonospora sp. WMMD1102 TaxID=3016105 RepID=UPI002414D67F|nr:hypothetical protein [Micromonospora sp. WMMD1102]MDG4784916.1 hypothetical protein [Micromonospora sp. WMMD1102]
MYLRLAKLIELVTGGQPARADIDRGTVDIALRMQAGEPMTRLYLGLTTAARLDRQGVRDAVPICRVGRHLASAAEAVAVAGEILAGHVPPMRDPLTPEGMAVRAGAGQKAGLADIAALAHDMLTVDAGFPSWLSNSHRLAYDVYDTVADEARWASEGYLSEVIQQVRSDAGDDPPLLHLLESPPIPAGKRAIRNGETARRSLTAARDWMYRNPGDVRAAHLAKATHAALAISVLATPNTAGADWRSWSAAAHSAGQLHGTPPHGPGASIARELDLVTLWVRPGPPRPGQLTSSGSRAEAIDKLAAVLPSLAEVLSTAARNAARHGNFFVVGRRQLERVPRSLVYHAVARWRVARPDDEQVYRLRAALFDAGSSALASAPPHLPRTAPRLAKLAFAATAEQTSRNDADAGSHQATGQLLPGQSHRDRSQRGR